MLTNLNNIVLNSYTKPIPSPTNITLDFMLFRIYIDEKIIEESNSLSLKECTHKNVKYAANKLKLVDI